MAAPKIKSRQSMHQCQQYYRCHRHCEWPELRHHIYQCHQSLLHKILFLSRNANLLSVGMDATNNPTATTNAPRQRRSTFDNPIPITSTTMPPFDVSCRWGLIWDLGGGEFVQSASVGVDAANNPTATTNGPH